MTPTLINDAAKLAVLKANLVANSNTVLINGTPTEISAVPASPDNGKAVAAWYNLDSSPNFWVWRTNMTRREVYFAASDLPSVFDFGTFKAQGVAEQGAWTQMFMGDSAPFDTLTLRDGVAAIFSGAGAPAAMRNHIFAVSRRLAKRVEKLFAVVVTPIGGLSPAAANGNTLAQPLGSTLNPAVMTNEGTLTQDEVLAAWAS